MAVPVGVVFAGPSLRPPRPTPAGVEYRPPAKRGDIAQAVRDGVQVVGLIDGVFHQSLAVTPAEVRQASNAGVRLFGGGSMGALRACECSDAMEGVGEIWRAFARGDLTDDDEVAVTFVPDTYEIVAYPLVQIREAARLAEGRYPECQVELGRFVDAVRGLPFQERTLGALRALGRILTEVGIPWVGMESWLTDVRFDVKRGDAVAVVEAVGREVAGVVGGQSL